MREARLRARDTVENPSRLHRCRRRRYIDWVECRLRIIQAVGLESSTVHAITTSRVPSNWMHAGFTVRSRGFSSPLVAHRAMTLQAGRPILHVKRGNPRQGNSLSGV